MAQAYGEGCLWISIDEKNSFPFPRKPDAQVTTGRGLSDAAFLVDNGNNSGIHLSFSSIFIFALRVIDFLDASAMQR